MTHHLSLLPSIRSRKQRIGHWAHF
ncbi:hypothetical protein Nmel_012573 [Mimus melanotis]